MEPAVTVMGKNRGGGIIADGAVERAADVADGTFGIFFHQFLSESVDKAFGTSGDADLDWIDALNPHGITEMIAPETVARGYDHLVDATGLYHP